MRRHGWGGAPPVDEAEARQRILDAARVRVDRDGAMQANLSDVAADLGVTRQTVYRYYPSTDELFSVLAQASADEFIGRVVDRMAGTEDPAEALVEGLAFTIERIPEEHVFALLLRTGSAFTLGIISEVSMAFGRSLLARTDIDWDALGYDDAGLDGLVEFMLRLIQSMAVTPLAPSGDTRSPEELRAFLRRWLGPAVTAASRITSDSG